MKEKRGPCTRRSGVATWLRAASVVVPLGLMGVGMHVFRNAWRRPDDSISLGNAGGFLLLAAAALLALIIRPDADRAATRTARRLHSGENGSGRRRLKRSDLAVARNLFGIVSALLPKRIADEEIGDALEDIADRIRRRRPRMEIRIKVASTMFWALLHGLEYLIGRILRAMHILDVIKVLRRP